MNEAVTLKAHGDEILRFMYATERPEAAPMVEMQTIRGAAGLALMIVALENCLTNLGRNISLNALMHGELF